MTDFFEEIGHFFMKHLNVNTLEVNHADFLTVFFSFCPKKMPENGYRFMSLSFLSFGARLP